MAYNPIKYQEAPTVPRLGNILVGGSAMQQVVSSLPTNFISAQNKDSMDFWIGAIVARHPSGTGLQLAHCGPPPDPGGAPYKPAIGIATLGAPMGFPEMAQVHGLFCVQDWTRITGQSTLTPMSNYWLDATGGRLINFSPSGGICQLIGFAISSITLLLDIQPPILL